MGKQKARLMRGAQEAMMHMIDSKWNHLKGVGLIEHYSKKRTITARLSPKPSQIIS
ncbi:MAG: hypothetical protein ABF912_11355 [Lacticaseibacillus paracasei]